MKIHQLEDTLKMKKVIFVSSDSLLSDSSSIIKRSIVTFDFLLPLGGTRGFTVSVYESFDPSDEKQIGITKLERRMPVLTRGVKIEVKTIAPIYF